MFPGIMVLRKLIFFAIVGVVALALATPAAALVILAILGFLALKVFKGWRATTSSV